MKPFYSDGRLAVRLDAAMIVLGVTLELYEKSKKDRNARAGSRALLSILEISKSIEGTLEDWFENQGDAVDGLDDALSKTRGFIRQTITDTENALLVAKRAVEKLRFKR